MWYQWRYIGNLIFVSCPCHHGWCHGASFLVVARWFSFSQIFTDEQKPFCSQGEPTNAGKRRQISQSLFANHQHLTFNTQQWLKRSLLSVGLTPLCSFEKSVLLCNSVRGRIPEKKISTIKQEKSYIRIRLRKGKVDQYLCWPMIFRCRQKILYLSIREDGK